MCFTEAGAAGLIHCLMVIEMLGDLGDLFVCLFVSLFPLLPNVLGGVSV